VSDSDPSVELYCQSYLNRYAEKGGLRCSCGREHLLQTRQILLGDGVMERLPGLLAEYCGSAVKIWILSDENTEEAAGSRCKQLLSSFSPAGTVLPAAPRPRTTAEVIRILSGEAGASSPDLILAVGSGTISDIAKMVSKTLNIPNWCVPTAPSVDAYSSGTSALKLPYLHKTEPARPAEVILADLGVLEKAPPLLFLSGVGDLLAKFLSYLDWRVSALVTGEYICEQTAALCLESARQALGAVTTLATNKRAAVKSLTDAILLSGLAMQALVSSRPASSAEHTIAHYWELDHAVGNSALELHGLLVGMSSRIMLLVLREFYGDSSLFDFDIEDRLRTLEAEASWQQALTVEVQHFHQQIREEMTGAQVGADLYRARLENVRKHGGTITDLAGRLLGELEQAIGILRDIEFPFHLSDYKLDLYRALLPIRYIRFLRNRYSSFNLIHEIGADQRVFGLLDRQTGMIR
jgi:glycerol-1-phosphate dehydrogenase [NAD(P)+]